MLYFMKQLVQKLQWFPLLQVQWWVLGQCQWWDHQALWVDHLWCQVRRVICGCVRERKCMILHETIFLKNEDIQRMHSTYSLVVKAGLYSVSHSAAFITIINCCTNKVKKSRRQVSIICFYEVKFLKTCKQYRKRTSCWQQTQHYAVDISCFVIKSNTASWVLKSTKTYKHHHSKQNRNLQ